MSEECAMQKIEAIVVFYQKVRQELTPGVAEYSHRDTNNTGE